MTGRVRVFVGEALRSLTSNLSTTIAATMTVLIGMFVLGLFIALGSWVLSWTGNVKEGVVVKVFFCAPPKCENEATPRQINAVRVRLERMPEVKSIVFVSKEDALRRMKEKYPDITKNLTANPLPPAFEVTPAQAELVKTIADKLEPPAAGVESVTYEEKTAERVLQFARVVGLIFLAGSAILLAAATVLIANTIRLSIFSRRREIEVMKLVGASNWFVRGPFMLEGLICGVLGSVAAVFLLLLVKELALPAFGPLQRASSEAESLGFPLLAAVLVLVSLLVGGLGSAITLRRFLKV